MSDALCIKGHFAVDSHCTAPLSVLNVLQVKLGRAVQKNVVERRAAVAVLCRQHLPHVLASNTCVGAPLALCQLRNTREHRYMGTHVNTPLPLHRKTREHPVTVAKAHVDTCKPTQQTDMTFSCTGTHAFKFEYFRSQHFHTAYY